MKKFIITGGPNSGKSTVLNLLAEIGFGTLEESSKILIETKKIMPWDNQQLFCEEFLKLQIEREKNIQGNIVFLDRSLVDPIAYAEISQSPIEMNAFEISIAEANYDRDVFLFQLLPLYRNETHRADTEEQAIAADKKLREVYTRMGFKVVNVPLFSDEAEKSKAMRLAFILGFLEGKKIL